MEAISLGKTGITGYIGSGPFFHLPGSADGVRQLMATRPVETADWFMVPRAIPNICYAPGTVSVVGMSLSP